MSSKNPPRGSTVSGVRSTSFKHICANCVSFRNIPVQFARKSCTEGAPPANSPCWERPSSKALPSKYYIFEVIASISSAFRALNPVLHPTPCHVHASRTEPTPLDPPIPIFSEFTARSVQTYHHPRRSRVAGLRPPTSISDLSSTICTASSCFCCHLGQNPVPRAVLPPIPLP